MGLLWVLVIGAVLTTLIKVGLELARGWLGIVISVQFGTQWAARVMKHLLHLPTQWFEVRHSGDIISRFQSTQSIQQTVTGKLVEIILDGLFALVTLVVILVYSPELGVIAIGAVIAYAAIRILPHGAYHRSSDEVMTHEAKAQTHFLESIRGIQVINLMSLEDVRISKWFNAITLAANRRAKNQELALSFNAGYNLVFGIESIAVLGWGAGMVINGVLTVGMLMAFISYKDAFSSRMQRFIDNIMSVRMLRLHVERLSDIVLTEQEETTGVMPEQLGEFNDHTPLSLKLENIGFRYGSGSNWVLRDLSIEFVPGEHVAIVGATGCGKTTLAKIILGLLEPTEGSLRINGIPVHQFGLRNWRKKVAAVMQDDQLFSGSLQDNISGFDEHIDRERVYAAAKAAKIHDEVLAMPMAYHSLTGDMGSSLSGGQKQRVLLARALYRQARILVLDEATSHLDVETERAVNEAIRTLTVTRITIAHRRETIAMADRVIDITDFSEHDR